MSKIFMLDTDICSYVIREHTPSMLEQFKRHQNHLCISSITYAELLFGAAKKVSERLTKQILLFVELLPVISWDQEAAKQYALIRYDLEKKGMPLDNMDLMIAALAKSKKITLVTNNRKHFDRIEGLLLAEWH